MENKIVHTNNDEFVKLVNVNKIYYKNVHAVYDFNLSIKKNEFIVFVGPSGCGKSTTLRMIAGLEDITSGELYINGELSNMVYPKDRGVAMVFQSYALYPNMTVFENMAFALEVLHTPKDEIKRRVNETAKILQLEDYLDRKPKNLSGGQRQRVALGRAIVRNARLFLMDEPLSNLDAKLRVQMRTEITKIHHQIDTTTIYVTHDQTEAMTMADRIVVMKDGYIQQIGTPIEIYRNPSNKFVASFIGSPAMNFATCIFKKGVLSFSDGNSIKLNEKVIKQHNEFYKNLEKETDESLSKLEDTLKEKNEKVSTLKRRHSIKLLKKEIAKLEEDKTALINQLESIKEILKGSEHELTFGIRPEAIKEVSSNAKNAMKCEVTISELLGDEYYVHFQYGGCDFLAKVATEKKITKGDSINLQIQEDKIHIFDNITEKSII